MNELFIFIFKIACIVVGIYIAGNYVLREKDERYYKFFQKLIFAGFMFATMWFFYMVWNAEKWQEIILNFIPFTLFGAAWFDSFENHNK